MDSSVNIDIYREEYIHRCTQYQHWADWRGVLVDIWSRVIRPTTPRLLIIRMDPPESIIPSCRFLAHEALSTHDLMILILSDKRYAFCRIIISFALFFLPRDAMQARPMSSCSVCPCVCPSVSWILNF